MADCGSKEFLKELMVVRAEQMLDTMRKLRAYLYANPSDVEFLNDLAPFLAGVLDRFAATKDDTKQEKE